MVDFVRDKQTMLGQKKLGQLQNTPEDQQFISVRFLNQKQPFIPVPGKIPADELPPDFNEIMLQLTQQMEAQKTLEAE